jgi:hypothetical protein
MSSTVGWFAIVRWPSLWLPWPSSDECINGAQRGPFDMKCMLLMSCIYCWQNAKCAIRSNRFPRLDCTGSAVQCRCLIVSGGNELLASGERLGRNRLPRDAPNGGGGGVGRDACSLTNIPQLNCTIGGTAVRVNALVSGNNPAYPLPSSLPSGLGATSNTQPWCP